MFSCVKAFTQRAALLSSDVDEVSLQLNGAVTDQKKKKVIRNLQENSSLVTFNGSQRPALQNKSAYLRRYNSVNK